VTLRLLEDADLDTVLIMANHQPNKDALTSNDLQVNREQLPGLLFRTMPGTESQAFSWNDLSVVLTLNDISHINGSARLGALMVNPDIQPVKGYRIALDAVAAVFSHGFDGLGLNRGECRVIEGNRLTPMICKELKCVEEGVMRKAVRRKGQYLDVTVYSMLASDYRGKGNGCD
jgi:hypothetical protein